MHPNPEPLELKQALQILLEDPVLFAECASGIKLRSYQQEVARCVAAAVRSGQGGTLVVLFPRQSGKNELQAQIEAYLLTLLSRQEAEMVKISPTWKPQSLNAMRRLERVLKKNPITRRMWRKESGYIYALGSARIFFLSGSPETNIVGATANVLLSVDEAQDVQISKFDKDILPMAASTNATRVFWGTAWTSKTLLARELRAARLAENRDRVQRVFVADAERVGAEVTAYAEFVAQQVQQLGRQHPLVKTQYYSEEIDEQSGMFPTQRQLLMRGSHLPAENPQPGHTYALLIDVGGEDEHEQPLLLPGMEAYLPERGRDATALTVVEVELNTLQDEVLQAPSYRVMARREWVGVRHTRLYADIRLLAEHWGASCVVIDATGVGAGLASFLEKALPGKVQPFVFTQKSKSDLGWGFLAVIETGRYQEHADAEDQSAAILQGRFWQQCEFCEAELAPGPGKVLRWGVPDGQRNPATGELVHDDLLVSAALCAVLDSYTWSIPGVPLLIQGRDPLQDLDRGF